MNFKFWEWGQPSAPPASPALPAAPASKRLDDLTGPYGGFSGGSLYNPATGLGDPTRDKLMAASYFDAARLTDPELQALFNTNALAARIVELLPSEMLRKGFHVCFPDPYGDEGSTENSELAEEAEAYADELHASERILEGMIWGRLFGGDALIVGADDGLDPSLPLNEENIRSIVYLNNVDRRYVFANTYYTDPFSPKFGDVETYKIGSPFGENPQRVIHESRIIRFDGAPVDPLKRRTLAGWTLSVLQRPYDSLRAYDTSFQAAANLMVDASQAVFKMKGLMDIITSDKDGILATRMAMVDYTRSAGRAVLVDADEEEFQRVATSFTGIPDMLDRFQSRLSGDTGYPVTLLFGRSAAGMNATGEGDARNWYDYAASLQESRLKPILIRLFTLICLAKDGPTGGEIPVDGIDIKFEPLWQMTQKELADLHYTQAQADALYLNSPSPVLMAEEVALSRFGGGEYSINTTIDAEARKKSLEAELDFSVQASQQKAENGPLDPTQTQPVAPGTPSEPEDK